MPEPAASERINSPKPRPTFEIRTTHEPALVLERLRRQVAAAAGVHGLFFGGNRAELTLEKSRSRIWEPQLEVRIEALAGGSKALCRFGPHPHVWMLYLALYMTSAFLAVACAVYGVVQWTLDLDPWALYLTPLAMLFAGLIYGASYVGQGLASADVRAPRLPRRSPVRDLSGVPGAPAASDVEQTAAQAGEPTR